MLPAACGIKESSGGQQKSCAGENPGQAALNF
jgi:hypothetical protein